MRAMLQQDDHKVVVDFDPLHLLELIDTLQRPGLSYHFEDENKRTLVRIYNKNTNNHSNYKQKQESLYAVALKFRLLRHHGYDIPAKGTHGCMQLLSNNIYTEKFDRNSDKPMLVYSIEKQCKWLALIYHCFLLCSVTLAFVHNFSFCPRGS